jgi:hypothetical protein
MNRFLNLVLAGTALVILSACGGGGDDADSSPVRSFNFSDLGAIGYGVEFDDGDAYVAFGCGKFVRYDENGNNIDAGTYRLVGNLVEVDSTVIGIDSVVETDASAPGEIVAGGTYQVTEVGSPPFSTRVTWIQDDSQTCP